jgi:hypothetical protein
MRRETLYAVTLQGGRVGVTTARTLASATKRALREEGTNNVKVVRHATDEDVSWIEAMGGYVPIGVVKI